MTTTDFISLEELKRSLGATSDFTSEDTKLLDVLEDARAEVDQCLKPYVDDVPLVAGTETYTQAAKCVLYYAKAHWFEYLMDLDKARYNHEMYENKIEKLKAAIISDKPERRQVLYVTPDKDPIRDNIYLTSQIERYISDSFGRPV